MNRHIKVVGTALALVVLLIPSAQARVVEPARAKAFTVTLSADSNEILVGESVTLSGVVTPIRLKGKVRLQRKDATGWVTIAKLPMGVDGSYGTPVTPAGLGKYVYRAHMPAVGNVAAANSPKQTVSVVEYHVIKFTIPAGTGGGAWNTSDKPVVGEVGDVLRVTNADSSPHRLHTYGSPFPHWASDLAPGQTQDFPLESTFTGWLYDHDYSMDAKFWITVTAPPA